MRRMRVPLSINLAACALLFASSAGAAGIDPNACADAAFQGQTLRDDANLLEAREQLRVCARQECPTFVQKDCAGWLEDVEKRLPSVVLSATDPSGRDLIEVKVTADGRLLTERLDGKSLPMNPGHHSFVFERDGGGSATIDVVLAEGEKDRRVSIVVSAPDKSAPAALPAGASEPRSRAWTVAGYTVAGAGVVGLGIGAVFGALAISEKSDANCDQSGACSNAGALADLRRSSGIATASLIVGGVLVAGGAALVLFAPRAGHAPGGTVQMTPVVGSNVAGFALEGAF